MRITSSCLRDEHGYGISVAIGGGLFRRTCMRCGDGQLDLRGATTPARGLFDERRRASWCEIGWNDTHGGLDFATGA